MSETTETPKKRKPRVPRSGIDGAMAIIDDLIPSRSPEWIGATLNEPPTFFDDMIELRQAEHREAISTLRRLRDLSRIVEGMSATRVAVIRAALAQAPNGDLDGDPSE